MSSIEILSLQPSQWQKYRDLRLRALKEEPQAYGSSYEDNIKHSNDFWRERLKEALEEKSQWLLFAKQGHNLVGMVGAFLQEDNVAQIIAVYVTQEMRGQGISRQLMDTLILKIAQNNSIKKLVVGVNPAQTAALNLYESLRFVTVKKEKMVLGDGKNTEVYKMEKILDNLLS